MKQYSVKHDTIILGRPVIEKDIVSLSDDDAKGYKAAGLIAEIKVGEPAKAQPEKTPAKKADK